MFWDPGSLLPPYPSPRSHLLPRTRSQKGRRVRREGLMGTLPDPIPSPGARVGSGGLRKHWSSSASQRPSPGGRSSGK